MIRAWKRNLLPVLAAYAFMTSGVGAQTPAPDDFRAIWLTTVSGLDFPGSAGTSNITAQRQRIVDMLDSCQGTGINAVVMQVRGECDAFYVSEKEPWSRSLTGTQGTAPARLWDPLQFTIDECRRRGLEIHAWFNPYRAGVNQTGPFAADHPLNDYSHIVEPFSSSTADYYWLNPGHPDTIPYATDVIMDVVDRYDIDGIHFDDYFYPYGIHSVNYPFPDSAEYSAYTGGGGSMSLADWRRENVNNLITEIKAQLAARPTKKHVRFGISPFGIWKSGTPTGISGLDAYSAIFADSRKWLAEGWVDYLVPQLYWGRAADGHSSSQDFDALLNWWTHGDQNPTGRQVFAGLAAYKAADAGWDASHIVNQVSEVQTASLASGSIFFRTLQLTMNSGAGIDNLSDLLAAGPYQVKGTTPAFTHMDAVAPGEPSLAWDGDSGTGYSVYWTPQGAEYPQWYVVYWQEGGNWSHQVVPDWQRSMDVPGSATNVAVQALDRLGNRSSMTATSLAGASPPVPSQFVSHTVRNHDDDALDFFTDSGTNSGVTTSADASSTEEANNRVDPRTGAVGSNSRKVPFSWTGASSGRYRLSTLGANPMVDLTQGVGVYLKVLDGELDIALGIRETGGSGPIGTNGGTTGNIEITSRQRVAGSSGWQYLYFDLPSESYSTLTGNSVLDGTWGVLEALFIYQVAGAPTSYAIYTDEIHQGGAHTPLGEPIRVRSVTGNSFAPSDVALSWTPSPALDIAGYRVYRSTSPQVETSPANLLAEVAAAGYTDTSSLPHTNYHYVVTAVDQFGYESPAGGEFSVTSVPVGMSGFELH